MAKRFTDTDKWKKPFIRGLQGAYKLLWFYICDDCDHGGVWQVDIEVAQLRIGEKITESQALKNFAGKIIPFDGGSKWFIPAFIEFQYPSGLNPDNKAHGGIIKNLLKYNLIDNTFKPLTSPLQGAKDKDMDKEQDMVMDMDKEEKPKKQKSEPGKKILFRESEYFDQTKLQIALLGTHYEHANVAYYHEAALTWSDSNQNKKIDWLATIKGFMARDMKENKFIDINYNPAHNGNKQAFTGNGQSLGTSAARIDALNRLR